MTAVAIILVAVVLGALVYMAVCPPKPRREKRREIEPSTSHNKFACATCANKKTPLCDHCFFVQHTDGTRAKPTWYIKMEDVCLSDIMSDKTKTRADAVDAAIMRYLDEGKPIPTALVHEHNSLREKRGD